MLTLGENYYLLCLSDIYFLIINISTWVLNVCLFTATEIIGYQHEDEETYNIDWKGSSECMMPKAVELSHIFIT